MKKKGNPTMNKIKVEQLTEVEVPAQENKLPPLPRFIALSVYVSPASFPGFRERTMWTLDGPCSTAEEAVREARRGGKTIESTIRVFEIPERNQ